MSKRGLDYLLSLPQGSDHEELIDFVRQFDNPDTVAEEIRSLLESGDSYVAPPSEFTENPSERLFENWEYPVYARTLYEIEEGRLLCLPPGSNRYQDYFELIPTVMERQLEANFPRLKSELANRPNLFFQGVFYPDEISIQNMEMISLHHGRNYVVRCELNLEGLPETRTVVLKPASMGVEAIITTLIDELNRRMPSSMKDTIGTISVPSIVAVGDDYGILEYIPGRNGVEVLPEGIDTGSIHTLRSNEYPEDFDIDADALLDLTDEFAKQAATAFYLRIYDRKPDQMIFERNQNKFDITHIDFGRGIKRNYALPWKRYYATERAPLEFEDHELPYFEAASSLIFIPHFIPESLREKFSPFEGRLRRRLKQCFTTLADFFQRNTDVIREHLLYLVGEKTQFDDHQVHSVSIEGRDIEEVSSSLLSFDPSPEEIFDSILNLARMERKGSTPTLSVNENDESIYMRGVRSGKTSRKLKPKYDGETPYELKDYKLGGQVYYEPEEQYLYINFGSDPQTIIDYVHWYYSAQLAEFIESFDQIQEGVTAKVYIDGQSKIRIPPGLVREDVSFPPEAITEVRQVVQGFAPQHHVENYVDSFRSWREDNPKANLDKVEQKRQSIIFSNNLEGKEVLQVYSHSENENSKLRDSISEIIYHMLSNPDYLADKDPIKSINNLVVNLGHKHEFIEPLNENDIPEDPRLEPMFESVFRLYNNSVSVGNFPDSTSQHVAHIRIMIELAQIVSSELDLSTERRRLLMTCVLMHDLNIFNEQLAELLLNPNGRLDRPIMQEYLDQHTHESVRYLNQFLRDELITIPDDIREENVRDILRSHHDYRNDDTTDLENSLLHQVIHLLDNFAVFADQTRPDEWDHGFIPLETLAPRWLDAEFERSNIRKEVYDAFNELFSGRYQSDLDRINNYTTTFLKLFNSLQMAASLDTGIDPQNPDLLYDLSERHGQEIIERIWDRVTDSNLPVYEKIRIFRRMDDLSPLFQTLEDTEFTFINATPRPIQRAVEKMKQCLDNGHLTILMGLFPRVTKAFGRFLKLHGEEYNDQINRIVAVSGLRRLHFIRHSYPYEADFEVPFHRIIQDYRVRNNIEKDLCLIPFERFFTGYEPTDNPESRVRELEKASDLEHQSVPEKVQVEAERYRGWESNESNLHIDDKENERLRRIILNDFTNREVLHFYTETLSENEDVSKALKEVIGALRENPNYLSERNSRYSIHELVRSLSQIHFFGDQEPQCHDRLRKKLRDWDYDQVKPFIQILECNGGELNFLKNTLVRALDILELLVLSEDQPPEPGIVLSLLSAGMICVDDVVHDYFVSPEDISYNQSLRKRLLSRDKSYTDELENTDFFMKFDSKIRQKVLSILDEANPPLDYGLIQCSLYTAFYLDFGRIENWERGRRRFQEADLEHLLEPIKQVLPEFVPERELEKLLNRLRSQFSGDNFELLNHLTSETNQYIYLFDALNLAAELRYGLFPGGVNTLENVRQLHGIDRINKLTDGIINSNLSVVESLKIFRKIRYLANALTRIQEEPDSIYFLNVDRTGTWSIPDSENQSDIYVLTGEYRNTIKFWRKINRQRPEIHSRTYILVGEEYPLLIKETSLSMTDHMRTVVTDYRSKKNRKGRHLLIPAEKLLRGTPASSSHTISDAPSHCSTAFFDTWLRFFE